MGAVPCDSAEDPGRLDGEPLRAPKAEHYPLVVLGRSWRTLSLAIAALLVGTGVFYVLHDQQKQNQIAQDRAKAAPALEIREETPPPAVLVFGDSFTAGSLENSGPTWVYQLAVKRGFTVIPAAYGGAGWLFPGGQHPFSVIADESIDAGYEPDAIVFAGGVNDVGKYENGLIVKQARRVISQTQQAWPNAQIIVMSPFGGVSLSSTVADLAARLRFLAQDMKLDYVDVTAILREHPELIGADDTHPNDDGHTYLAEVIDVTFPDVENVRYPNDTFWEK